MLGFLTAIGQFRMRNWARYPTLAFSGFLPSIGLVMALVFVAMPIPVPPLGAAKVLQCWDPFGCTTSIELRRKQPSSPRVLTLS